MFLRDAAGAPAAIGEVIAPDGRQFRDTSVPGGQAGHLMRVVQYHWVTGAVMGSADVPITVVP